MSHETGLYFAQFPRNFDRLQVVLLSVDPVQNHGHEFGSEMSAGPSQFYREIIFTEPELLIAPQSDEYQDKAIIIAESNVLASSRLCGTLEKFSLKITTTNVPLTRNLFMYCCEFVLKHRLAPFWNKIGPYYIKGRDFLQEKGKLCAIKAYFSLTNKITVALKAQMVKLPPQQIEDCGVSPNIMQQFHSTNYFSIDGHSIENNTCLVLPSLKTGYITRIAHSNTEDFDFKRYWKVMYGFRLPESRPQDIMYSIRFPAGNKTFLYPEYCIRSKEPHVYLRCDQKAILSSFIEDLASRLPSICCSPLKFTTSSLYPTKTISSASLSKQTNLTRSARPSNSSEMFVFTGTVDQNRHSDKTVVKSTISSPQKTSQGETSSGGVTHCDNKPYVPCFTNKIFSGNLAKKTIFKKNSQREVQQAKPIVPCFMRKSTNKSSSSEIKIYNSVTITKSAMASTGNEVVLDLSITSCEKQNGINGKSTLHSVQSAATPVIIDHQQCKSVPMVNRDQPSDRQHEKISDAAQKCSNPKVKRSEKRQKAETNIDIKKLAIENKLSKVNAAAISKWLKAEGVHYRSKDRKADLLLKVYGHLGLKQAEP